MRWRCRTFFMVQVILLFIVEVSIAGPWSVLALCPFSFFLSEMDRLFRCTPSVCLCSDGVYHDISRSLWWSWSGSLSFSRLLSSTLSTRIDEFMEMCCMVSCRFSDCSSLSYLDDFHKGCWIINQLKAEQLLYGSIGKWVCAILMAILYITMFIVMRGWLIVDNGVWYWYRNYQPRYGVGQPEIQEEKDSKSMAKLLLLWAFSNTAHQIAIYENWYFVFRYPVVYIICVTPKAVARCLFFFGFKVPYQVTFATNTLFSLSGVIDATLCFFTRPNLVVGAADPPPLGSLPNCDLAASDIPPDHERGRNGQFESYYLTLRTEDANSNICLPIGSDSDIHASVPAPAPVEEPHRHLPSR